MILVASFKKRGVKSIIFNIGLVSTDHVVLSREYGMALASRLLKIIGLFCKRAL